MKGLWGFCAALAVGACLPAGLVAAQAVPEAPAPSKMMFVLEKVAGNVARAWDAGERDMSRMSNGLVKVSPDGFIHVALDGLEPIDAAAKRELAALGVRGMSELRKSARVVLPVVGRVEAWVPFARMQEVAAHRWVKAMTPAYPGVPHAGPIQSEGAVVQGAVSAQSLGLNGTGVRVGVVSDGVENLKDSQARGELDAVEVQAVGEGNEGVAMLEIVHDMAPGAELAFHATGESLGTHLDALLGLVDWGANIITEDFGFLLEPVFQYGLAAQVGDSIANGRVAVFSSAGNEGLEHAARIRALGTGKGPDGKAGPFADCGSRQPTNVLAIAPNGDTTFDLVLGDETAIILQWSEPRATVPTPGQGGFTDLDLYVMDEGLTRCIDFSQNKQGFGRGDSAEAVSPGKDFDGQKVKLVVSLVGSFGAAEPPVIDLRWSRSKGAIDTPTREGSLTPDANYMGRAASVAAVNADVLGIEPFSSGGPIQLGLTTLGDGSRGPGPGVLTLTAPTLASADAVSISGAGGFPDAKVCPATMNGPCRFGGTSAAAPHAAGCAALALQAMGPSTTVAALMDRLIDTAADDTLIPGRDNVFGFGLVRCGVTTLAR